jgi:hypothetical protein
MLNMPRTRTCAYHQPPVGTAFHRLQQQIPQQTYSCQYPQHQHPAVHVQHLLLLLPHPTETQLPRQQLRNHRQRGKNEVLLLLLLLLLSLLVQPYACLAFAVGLMQLLQGLRQ